MLNSAIIMSLVLDVVSVVDKLRQEEQSFSFKPSSAIGFVDWLTVNNDVPELMACEESPE